MSIENTRPALPPARWLFTGSMVLATTVALVSGVPLGFFAATSTGLEDRWPEVVQAHGRLQLGAWASVFVVALAFEFLPRLNERPWLPAGPRAATIGLLLAGAVLQAWALATRGDWLMAPAVAISFAGALAFLALVLHLRARKPLVENPQALFFPAAAAWLAVAAALSLVSEFRSDSRVVPLEDSRLVVEVLTRGFLLNAVIAVALRAFPEHFGLPVVPKPVQLLALVGISGTLAVWLVGSGAVGLPDSEAARRISDCALPLILLATTISMGILTRLPPLRGSEPARILIPLAWVGLVVYAGALVITAILADSAELTLYEQGAVRHVFLLGFIAPLILAMGHLVLAHFGPGAVPWPALLNLSVLLAVISWPLRTAPMLWEDVPGTVEQTLMGVSGVLLSLSLSLSLAVYVRSTSNLAAESAP
ncbi:MAG TPA: hypothetical protein QGF35_00110 [Dehalococcoidia bacterium]|nr:hypothetical protein [Dehalococcoidia bacterium]